MSSEAVKISNEDRWRVLAECGPSQAQLADTIIRLREHVAALQEQDERNLAELVAVYANIESAVAERDLAREDCGHQRAMKESIRHELTVFINLKMAADGKIATLEAERDSLRAALVAAGDTVLHSADDAAEIIRAVLAGVPVDSTEEK